MTPLAQEIETTRRDLCYLVDSPAILQTHLERCLSMLRIEGFHDEPLDLEAIELWAGLATTIAGMLSYLKTKESPF